MSMPNKSFANGNGKPLPVSDTGEPIHPAHWWEAV